MYMTLGQAAPAVAPPAPGAAAAAALLKRTPAPSPDDLTSFFKGLPKKDWSTASTLFVSAGVPGEIVRASMYAAVQTEVAWAKGALTLASAAISGFHGTRRNNSIFWGAWWFIMGLTFPIFTPVVAFAQGVGKRKGS